MAIEVAGCDTIVVTSRPGGEALYHSFLGPGGWSSVHGRQARRCTIALMADWAAVALIYQMNILHDCTNN